MMIMAMICAPRFLIPSLFFLLLGKRISLAEWVAPGVANPYASHAVHDRALFLSTSSGERESSARSMLCVAERVAHWLGVFCSEEEDVVPSDIILGGRGAVGAGITVLGAGIRHDTRAVPASGSGLRAFRQWQPSETGTRDAQGKESVEQSGLGNGNGYSECCTVTVHTLELHRRR